MRVLLTGASSFTGYWFAQSLHDVGANVVAPLRGMISEYAGIRAERVSRLAKVAKIVEACPFGSLPFLSLAEGGSFDVLCHHAAQVTNYRSPDFDAVGALASNTLNLQQVLTGLKSRGLRAVVVTGSVFEHDEGISDPPGSAFSPYGLSKGLTWQTFRYWCGTFGIPLGKFVIANPFGPFEEPRFCSFLIDQWRANKIAEVRTPAYVRDNIHVDLLALGYAAFVKAVLQTGRNARTGLTGYRETQGAFAQRFAQEMRFRLGLECGLELPKQKDFSEPIVQLNPDVPDHAMLGWDEMKAWDQLAAFYRRRISAG